MNSVYFSEEEVKAKDHIDLITFLMKQSYSMQGDCSCYNDIRIKPEDCGAFVVEWDQVPWSHDYGGSWQWVDEDHIVMKELHLPDGSYQYVKDDEEDEVFEDWLKDNQGYYEKDQYGIYHYVGSKDE